MDNTYRNGVLVNPYKRLNTEQIKSLHGTSLSILEEIGIVCHNEHAADILDKVGCKVKKNENNIWQVFYPGKIVENAIKSAPKEVILGARDRKNRLKLNADIPLVYYGTGSETNFCLETKKEDNGFSFYRERGSVSKLCSSAKLCNKLENVDFFIRNVNLQDPEINVNNKDVNVFFAAFLYMTKHVQAGLVNIEKLDDIMKLASIIAGSREALKENPVVSFITCIIKSPLQMVEDTTEKLMEIAKRGLPVVLSSSPQGGSTAPIQEEGMVSMINAEILAGIVLTQVINPGTPVLYGAVPVRARLDNLHDLYGAPEFIHYNIDCIQLARHYGIPCYSTAGVGDAKVPGLQATIEKVFSQLQIAQAGAQYVHYSIGLLDKTNIFCPLQAVLDDEHIGIVKNIIRPPVFGKEELEDVKSQLTKVMESGSRIFARYIRKAMRRGVVSPPYAFETHEEKDAVFEKAYERLNSILHSEPEILEKERIEKIYNEVPGLLGLDKFILEGES